MQAIKRDSLHGIHGGKLIRIFENANSMSGNKKMMFEK